MMKTIRDYINLIENLQREGVAEGSSDRRKQEQEADKWLEKRIMKCTCPTSARNNPKCPVHGKKKGVAEEQVEESSPDAIAKINELTRR